VISDSDGGAPEAKITGRALSWTISCVLPARMRGGQATWPPGDGIPVQIRLITVIEWDLDRAQLTAAMWSPNSGARVRHRSYP
jgi:hypothetical protein